MRNGRRTAHLMVACALAFASAIPSRLTAQSSCTANPSSCSTSATALRVTITIGKAFALTLSPGSTPLAAPTAAAYNAGFAQTTGPTATVRSNTPWALAISASAATWTGVDTQTEPSWKTKPASDLHWGTSVGGPFTAMTTTPVTVRSGTATAGTAVPLFFQTNYGWTMDTPGNYSLQLVFTTTAP